MAYNKEIGKAGEDEAAKYLESKGYNIITRNFYCRIGEIDIIARDGDYLVFIEVKTRKSLKYGYPVESISKKKVRGIIKTAQTYIHFKNIKEADIRFDVIEVILDNNGEKNVNHIQDAFQT
jgi:putative endonuclease